MIERRLEDGTRFRLVKVPHSAADLEGRYTRAPMGRQGPRDGGTVLLGAGTPM